MRAVASMIQTFWVGVRNEPTAPRPIEIVRPVSLKHRMGLRSYFAMDEDGDLVCVVLGLITLVRYKSRVLYYFGVPESIRPLSKEMHWYS